jgi:hypothetical protein
MSKKSKVATKHEVLHQLSTMLRKDDLSDQMFIKLLVAYGRLQNWWAK